MRTIEYEMPIYARNSPVPFALPNYLIHSTLLWGQVLHQHVEQFKALSSSSRYFTFLWCKLRQPQKTGRIKHAEPSSTFKGGRGGDDTTNWESLPVSPAVRMVALDNRIRQAATSGNAYICSSNGWCSTR